MTDQLPINAKAEADAKANAKADAKVVNTNSFNKKETIITLVSLSSSPSQSDHLLL